MNRLAIIIVMAGGLVQERFAWGGSLNQDFRTSYPVVVTGKDVAALLGMAPNSIVGFAWRDGKWVTRDTTFPDTGAFAYGASGPLYGPYPQTVPKGEPGDYMVIRRRFLFGPPGLSLDQVKAVVEQPAHTLEAINR